jgi:ABC-type xylose transport system permease subunit
MIHGYEDAAARKARLRDTAISGLVAAAALVVMVITTGEKRWGPIYAVAILTGGVVGAVLDARRAGWRWAAARVPFLSTLVAAVVGYGIWWFFYR